MEIPKNKGADTSSVHILDWLKTELQYAVRVQAMRQYNSVHRQQLFHWIGDHIERRAVHGRLDDGLRNEYVECLRSSLTKGLWANTPRDRDFVGDGTCILVGRPITCFTEWSLDQSRPHTLRYGRLGLGFPKRFVLNHGGQPVAYLRDGVRNAPYAVALNKLGKWFQFPAEDLKDEKDFIRAREQFFYLAHFNKRIKRQRVDKPSQHGQKKASMKSRKVVANDPYKRSFGPILHYLEEREWRIVYDKALARHFQKGDKKDGRPEYYLRYKPGKDLFTIVLPDNKTINLALNCGDIQKALYPDKAPHVTVISLDEIGTF